MSSIMRWRNGLMGLSVMAITPVSHEVSEPHDLETGRAILLIPTSNPPRARSRWGVYRESGLVHGSNPAVHGAGTKRVFYPLASANPVSVSNFFAYVEDRFVREYAGQRAPVSTCICARFSISNTRPRRRETSKAPSRVWSTHSAFANAFPCGSINMRH